jgi:small subunit ribosomal protein S4
MARYTGPVCRQCRREGLKLYLKGDRCYTEKCAVDKRSYPPGEHGTGRKKASEYALQLREKQKLRRTYGVLERQFERYFNMATRTRGMITGEALLQILESRLDSIVYRIGFASSRPEARQMVMHGHIAVNGRKVDIPSYLVKAGDVVEVRELFTLDSGLLNFNHIGLPPGPCSWYLIHIVHRPNPYRLP